MVTEDGVEDNIISGIGNRFPSIDNLLLELVQERVVLLLLALALVLDVGLGLLVHWFKYACYVIMVSIFIRNNKRVRFLKEFG